MTDSIAATVQDAVPDAILAAAIFVRDPKRFGGIILRGDGPVRDDMVAAIGATLATKGPVLKIPINVDAERLLGGLDLAATLAAGRGVQRAGILSAAAGGAVIIPMSERIGADISAHVAQAMDGGALAAIMLDDGRDGDEAPPKVVVERVAFACDLSDMRLYDRRDWPDAIPLCDVQPLPCDALASLAATAYALGVGSARALNFAHAAARGHAALNGRAIADDSDSAAAVRMVLVPRATRMPPAEQQDDASPPPPESHQDKPQQESRDPAPEPDQRDDSDTRHDPADMQDMMVDAAAAAIPPHILDMIEKRLAGQGRVQSGRAGQKQASGKRGRPKASRPGMPGGGRALALIDTLRAAAPFQAIRRMSAPADGTRRIHIRARDLHVRRFEQRRESLTIFVVDASGSSAISRLAEAKGAVELMLAQAYVKRAQVALIAFRGTGAEVLLPPTRSLTRARRALSALPGGGGTPLAAGLTLAQAMATLAQRNGQTPMLAILTDGKANLAADGRANRAVAMAEAQDVARMVRDAGFQSIIIDISPRPQAEAAAIADALGGRYLPLPRANSAAMVSAIQTLHDPQTA